MAKTKSVYEPRLIDGEEVLVEVCKPSRRKAHSKLVFSPKSKPQAGANYLAREREELCK